MIQKKTVLLPALLVLGALACTVAAPAGVLRAAPVGAPTQTPNPTQAPTQTATPTEAPTAAPISAPACVVLADALNVRACPGLDCAPVAWLRAGEIITPTGSGRGWIAFAGGWVNQNFVRCDNEP